MQLNKLECNNKIFTGLVYDENSNDYWIIWGHNTAPEMNIEYFLGYTMNEIQEGKIEINLIENSHGHLFSIIKLQNKKEYNTAATIIKTLLGEQDGA